MTELYDADGGYAEETGQAPVDMSERPVPSDVPSEMALIGLAMRSQELADTVIQAVPLGDYFQPRHAMIAEVIASLGLFELKVDPIAVMNVLLREDKLELIGGANYLHTLFSTPAVDANAQWYAERIRKTAMLRRAVGFSARIAQRVHEGAANPDECLDAIAVETMNLAAMLDEPTTSQGVTGYGTWTELWNQPDDPYDWIVDGLIERQDVMMVLAEEGLGKSWWNRQFCMAISAGIHPLHPERRIPARPTLYVDPENAVSMVRRQSRFLGNQVARLGRWDDSLAKRWLIPRGLNLRKAADARLFESVVAESGAHFIGLGSLYKMFQRSGDDWDTASAEVRDVLDNIREKYRVAYLIEHHMPKGGGRAAGEENPYGSSEWMRWVSHGRVVRKTGDNAYALTNFRAGDRDEREYPVGLYRGGLLPWAPIWDADELEAVSDSPKKGRAA